MSVKRHSFLAEHKMASRRPNGTKARRANGRPAPAAVVNAFQRFVGEVFRLNGQLLATAEDMSRPINISPARWQTIAILRNGPMTVANMARRLGLRRQSVQHNVNRLLAQRLAILRPNPNHRRARLVELTSAGRKTMGQLHSLQTELTTRFVGPLRLKPAQLENLTATLRRVREQAASDDGRSDH
jgi:DNA-binding MarR family transcriptional regulator